MDVGNLSNSGLVLFYRPMDGLQEKAALKRINVVGHAVTNEGNHVTLYKLLQHRVGARLNE